MRAKQIQMLLTGAAIGAAAFLLLYGFSPLNPLNDAWLRGGYVERDTVQHYAGWLFYRASPLTFPLGIAQNMNVPFGAYVGLADSIPLFALLFRLLAPVLPAGFQYFGLWGFLCSVLQGAAAALLLGLFTQKRLHNALCTLLFVLAPIFLDRQLRHAALGAQWLLLFALYLYFKHRRAGTFFSGGFLALCALSVGIHPYFTPMILALLLALLLENAVHQRKIWQPAAMLGACLAAVLASSFVLGVFYAGAGSGGTPYGYFSMNLNALWNPKARGYHWSLMLPEQNQTLGNYDGFNYLGLGVLLGLFAIAVDILLHLKNRPARQFLWAFAKRRAGLGLVCACLTVFAVSNQITANGAILGFIPLPASLRAVGELFRSSGRMFYPVWYLLLLVVCVYALRRPAGLVGGLNVLPTQTQRGAGNPGKLLPAGQEVAVAARTPFFGSNIAVAASVCVLVAVQLLDISPALAQKARDFRPYEAMESPMKSDFWAETAGRFSRIASLDKENLASGMDLALYAADHGMLTDDAFTARYDTAQRASQRAGNLALLSSGNAPTDVLFVTSVEATFLEYAEDLQEDFYCALIDERWFVFAPYSAGFSGYGGADALAVANYPLHILDYSDALWERGVLISDRRVVAFEDSAFVRRRVESASALVANGQIYAVLERNYEDEGWIMVTLDSDATALQGQVLESVP